MQVKLLPSGVRPALVFFFCVASLLIVILGQPASAAQTCPTSLPEIDRALKVELDREGKGKTTVDAREGVALGDTIQLEGDGIEAFAACATQDKPVVLFLNGQAIGDIRPEPSRSTKAGEPGTYTFTLVRGDLAQPKWASILGSPRFGLVYLPVSIGLEGRNQLESHAVIGLQVLQEWRLVVWLLIFFALLGLFVWLCRCSNILRGEGNVEAGTDRELAERPAYSLSRTQGAWWFFVIIAAYILIGLVTGDFTRSINATALILLGIGSATALASATVDSTKNSSAQQRVRQQAAEDASKKVANKGAAVQAAKADLDEATTEKDKAEKLTDLNAQNKDLDREKQALDIINNRSRGFWVDILSDANGVSFHRFQNVAWTLILSVVFAKGVYHDLAMPTFDATLLGLMGLSAATYVGLKIPEATVPAKKT